MTLFDKDHRYTDKAIKISNEFHAALKEVFSRHGECSPRELEYLVIAEASVISLEILLTPAEVKAKCMCPTSFHPIDDCAYHSARFKNKLTGIVNPR